MKNQTDTPTKRIQMNIKIGDVVQQNYNDTLLLVTYADESQNLFTVKDPTETACDHEFEISKWEVTNHWSKQ
jgi:hypothetical protein